MAFRLRTSRHRLYASLGKWKRPACFDWCLVYRVGSGACFVPQCRPCSSYVRREQMASKKVPDELEATKSFVEIAWSTGSVGVRFNNSLGFHLSVVGAV